MYKSFCLSLLQVVVESCDTQIKSIEIQLVRVETCGCAEGYAKDGKDLSTILANFPKLKFRVPTISFLCYSGLQI